MSRGVGDERSAVRLEDVPGGLRISGEIDYDNAGDVMLAGAKRLEALRGPVSVDLVGLRAQAGSLVVALMLAWLRHATNRDVEIEFAGVTDAFREIINVSGLADTLPLSAEPTG